MDGIPENDILEDENQMKNISAVVEKLQHTGSNYGENHIYKPEDAGRIKNQGTIEWTDLRQTTRTTQCRSCLQHVPEGMIKCYCGYMTVLTIEYMNELNDRFRTLCQSPWKVRMKSRGFKHCPQQWQEDHRRAKEHLRGVKKQVSRNRQN